MTSEWGSLDSEARVNLPRHAYLKFLDYKISLADQGHEWKNDAEDILRGWIWNEIEYYEEQEQQTGG
jgi:hypothetical protein